MNFRVLFFLTLLAAPLVAQEPGTGGGKVDVPVRKQVDAFFASIEGHQIDAAYDHLVKGTKIAERVDDVVTLKTKTLQAVQLFGDMLGHELIDVKNVGTHLLRATYVSLGKDFPLRWRFYYYRSAEEWKLIDIRVDDRLADMFGEPAVTDRQTPTNWPRQ